mgnify:CR=1 FL=1
MTQESPLLSSQGMTVSQAFEEYIESQKLQKEGKRQEWKSEKKYRTTLELLRRIGKEVGIDMDSTPFHEFNTVENIEKIMTFEPLLKGEKIGDMRFGSTNVRGIGNHLSTVFNAFSGRNSLSEFNKAALGRPNPFAGQKGVNAPFKTIGFPLTVRDDSFILAVPPNNVILEAYKRSFDEIEDLEVRGKNQKIPAKTIKAYMMLHLSTGMRQPDLQNLSTIINPTAEDVEKDLKKTFLRDADKVLIIRNAKTNQIMNFGLNPMLYSVLKDAAESSIDSDLVFPNANKISEYYQDIVFKNLQEVSGLKNPIQKDVKGTLQPHPFGHQAIRKIVFSIIERTPESEGGGLRNADAAIQHIERGQQTEGERRYATNILAFQDSPATRGQSVFTTSFLGESTPAQFLIRQGFNEQSFPREIYDLSNRGDVTNLSSRQSASFIESQLFKTNLEQDESLSDASRRKIFEEFGSFSNAQELYDLDRRTIEQDYNKYVKSLTDAGSEDIATEERYYDLVKKGKLPKFEPPEVDVPFTQSQSPSLPEQIEDLNLPSREASFTDTSLPEGIEPTVEEQRRKSSDVLRQMREGAIDFAKDKGPKAVLGLVTGGAGVLANVADAAADVALTPTEVAYGGLDPAEEIMGRAERRSLFASDDMSDTELLERMQAASSQRLSTDKAERTTALADIEANRRRLEERGFSPIARQQVEQSRRDLRESGLGDYGETTQAESMRQLFSELQDVDTSEAFTQEAREARIDERIQRAKIAAEAAEDFNRVN